MGVTWRASVYWQTVADVLVVVPGVGQDLLSQPLSFHRWICVAMLGRLNSSVFVGFRGFLRGFEERNQKEQGGLIGLFCRFLMNVHNYSEGADSFLLGVFDKEK